MTVTVVVAADGEEAQVRTGTHFVRIVYTVGTGDGRRLHVRRRPVHAWSRGRHWLVSSESVTYCSNWCRVQQCRGNTRWHTARLANRGCARRTRAQDTIARCVCTLHTSARERLLAGDQVDGRTRATTTRCKSDNTMV
jgi:hypothetical protein